MYELTVQGLSFWQSLNFLKLINIIVLIPVSPFFLMWQGRLQFALSLKEYLEKNYNYLRNMGETKIKEKVYKTKNLKCGETC